MFTPPSYPRWTCECKKNLRLLSGFCADLETQIPILDFLASYSDSDCMHKKKIAFESLCMFWNLLQGPQVSWTFGAPRNSYIKIPERVVAKRREVWKTYPWNDSCCLEIKLSGQQLGVFLYVCVKCTHNNKAAIPVYQLHTHQNAPTAKLKK
jgi:hypothetical protein